MEIGDLVEIRCTCGEACDADPLIAVVVDKDKGEVQVLLNSRRHWVEKEGVTKVHQ